MFVPAAAGGTCLYWLDSEGRDAGDADHGAGVGRSLVRGPALELLPSPSVVVSSGLWASAVTELGGDKKWFPKEKGWNMKQKPAAFQEITL